MRFKPQSEFSKNVLTLMTGTTMAQAIPIAVSPILTRIYTPEDFGAFALYIAVVSVFLIFATSSYEQAIVLPRKDKDAKTIVVALFMLTSFISIILLIFVAIFKEQLGVLVGDESLSNLFYLIPLSTMIMGFYNSLMYWNIRKKQYLVLSKNKIIQGSVTSFTSIAFGLSYLSSIGLFIASVTGQFLATLLFLRDFKNEPVFWSKRRVYILLKKYNKFPKFTMPSVLLTNFSTYLPSYFILYFFSLTSVGFFSLANKIVAVPLGVIGNAYSHVFFETFSSLQGSGDKTARLRLVRQKFIEVNIISIVPFVILFFYLPDIFSFVYGETWKSAGVYAQILLPMLYLRFVGSIFSSIPLVYMQQGKNLVITVINVVFRVLALIVGGLMYDIELAIILFSTTSSIIVLYKFIWFYKLVHMDAKQSKDIQ